MGRGPFLRSDGPFGSSLVAAFGQLEPDEADRIERCFGHSRSGWGFVFVGCRRKNATYSALVIVCGTAQWLMCKGWRS